MPFAMNEATRFINPTKALEYMATSRPIVSTPVEDVVLQFSDVVAIGNDRLREFIAACAQSGGIADAARIVRGRALRGDSWESIVAPARETMSLTRSQRSSTFESDAA